MRERTALLALALLVLALSLAVRALNHQRIPRAGDDAGWFAADPDGLYHMRRLDRALAGGLPVAPFDPYLAFPAEREAGSPIPWPPYYTLALYGLVAPFAPDAPAAADPPLASDDAEPGGAEAEAAAARRSFVEHSVATWPAVFSALCSALLALGAAGLVRGQGAAARTAALVAGLTHALAFAALRYAYVGNGDHHAFVSLGYGALLVAGSLSLSAEALRDVPRSVLNGTVCGVVAGGLLGSWVASLELLALFELALFWLWFTVPDERTPGLAAFAAPFHGAATLVLLPAVVGSPWAILTPASLVELTWLHPALLASGLAFFALRPASRGLRALVRGASRSSWGPALPVVLLAILVLLALRSPLGPSVREALAWAGGRGDFMGFTNESRPLVGGGEGVRPLLKFLGWTSPLAVAGAALGWRRVRSGATEWAPCVVAFPLLFVQAMLNRRFAELAVVPQALLLGLLAAQIVGLRRRAPLLLALAAAAGHPATLRSTWVRGQALLAGDAVTGGTPAGLQARGERALMDWLRRETPAPGDPPRYGVLAQWDLGHAIAWAADRPVVATNFGAYLGLDSYLDPWRFFLELSERRAEELLERRRVEYVVVTSRFRRNLDSMVRVLHPDEREVWIRGSAGEPPRWLAAMGARLQAQAGGPLPGDPTRSEGLAFLRLVYLSPDEYRDHERPGAFGPAPLGAVFQRVAGARVRAAGSVGETLRATVRLRFPGVERERVWRASAPVGADGFAELRVPYATGARTGAGTGPQVGSLGWSLGARRGELEVSDEAVRTGAMIDIP